MYKGFYWSEKTEGIKQIMIIFNNILFINIECFDYFRGTTTLHFAEFSNSLDFAVKNLAKVNI